MFSSLIISTINFSSIFSQMKWVTKADRSGFDFSLSLSPCPSNSSPLRCRSAATTTATGRRVAASSCHYLILCRCLASPCRCLAVPLHVVLCEFNEPHSQSFRVGTQVCSKCVSILILSSIFKHCTNLKNLLAGVQALLATAQLK
jgi:hypothetical protein